MPPSPPDPGSLRAFRRQVALLSVGHLLAFIDRTKIVGLIPTIRRQMAMSEASAGWIIGTAFALGYAVCIAATLMLDGRRVARSDLRARLGAGIALWGMASVATGLATSVATLIAARAIMGVGQALFIPAAVSRLSTDGEAVGTGVVGLSRFTAAASVGRSAGLFAVAMTLIVVGRWASTSGSAWRWVFVLTALPNIALFYLVLREPRGGRVTVAAAMGSGGWTVRFLYLALILLPFILIQGLGGWLPTLLEHDRGVGAEGGATWAGIVALIAGTSSQLVAGWLLQRAGRWRGAVPMVIVAALIATVPGIALTGWGSNAVFVTIGALWASLTLGAATFAALFGWQRLIPEADRLAANGIFFAIITVVGLGVGPLLTGILADRGLALRGALLAIAVGFAAIGLLLAFVVQPLYRRHAQA